MAGLTATQFYSYPTGADAPCDAPTALKAMVDQIDDALSAMRATVQRAKNPPMVIVEFNPPAPVAIDSFDNIEWNTVVCDDGGFFDVGLPTIFTFPAGGRYLAGVNARWTGVNAHNSVGVSFDLEGSVVTPADATETRGGSVSAFLVAATEELIVTPYISWQDTPAPSLEWAQFWAFLVADYA